MLYKQKQALEAVLDRNSSLIDIIVIEKLEGIQKNPAIFLITKDKDSAEKIKSNLSGNVGILEPEEIYQTSIGVSLICEGFSIKKGKFLRDINHIRPMKIYSYSIEKFTPTEKRQFNRGINKALEKTKGQKLGAGCCMIPIENTPYFEEFLAVWKDMQYKTKKWTVFEEIH